ncbi:MAG: hypothetical protein QOG62_1073 [Thermoleophilaceae bacterium]|nr:hypothetical protein [Thermoleophilaceae bacterium]
MPQENVDVVRRGYEHVSRTGDLLPEIFHPDFVWDMSRFGGWLERQTYAGIEGAREFMSDWAEAWDEWELKLADLREAGGQVVAIATQTGRSRVSGLRVDMEFAQVWSLADGLQIRMEMYADVQEALAAAGLSD